MLKVAVEPRVGHAGRLSRFAGYAWGVLAYNVAVVLWGAYVRATGSGAGCGNHWPLCNGQLTLQSPTTHMVIEFSHRAMSGIDTPLVLLLVLWAFRGFAKGHPARLGAALSGVFLVTEALLGAALVKLGHVANNTSPMRAWSDSAHLVNTLTLLACLTLTAWWGAGRPAIRLRGREGWLVAVSVAVMMVLGISGAITALGDTLFPAHSLAAGFAQDLDPASSIFLRLRIFHPMIAAGSAVWLAFYAMTAAYERREARRFAWAVGGLLVTQLAAGALNLVLLAPVWMQMVHLLLADLLWIALVLLCATSLAESGPAVSGPYKAVPAARTPEHAA
jgi:heme A synthase